MAICKNCGCFTKDVMEVCPKCGYSARKAAAAAKQKKKTEKPVEQEQRVKQAQPEKPAEQKQRVQPAQPEKPVEQKPHAKHAQQGKSAAQKQRVKKAQPEKTFEQKHRAKHAQTKKTVEQKQSVQPAQPEKPVKQNQRVQPAQPEKPVEQKQHAKQAKSEKPVKQKRRAKHAQAENTDGKKPAKTKKSKAPLVVLISLLVILLIIGGLAYYLLTRNNGDKDDMTFELTCAEFTTKMNLNRSATPDEVSGLDVAKWTLNQSHTSLEYVGGGFTMKAKTVKNGDVNSKMKELRVGPTDTETGVNMVALSIVTLEDSLERDAAMRAMSDVKSKVKDKISYENVAFTYDRDKDEFVMIPSKGAKYVANKSATSDEPAFPAVSGTPVSGSGIIKAGGQYFVADVEGIKSRQSVTDKSRVVIADKNNGQLLSNGETIFYIREEKNKSHVCSVKADGTQNQTLFSLNGKVTPIHLYNDCLYYVCENKNSPGGYDFCRYSLTTKETKQYKDISFDPDKAVVSGDIMYCSKAPDVNDEDRKNTVCKFDFASEKYTEEIENCSVSPHGYFNGSGNPCFDSFIVNGEDETLSEHFLYTAVDGELKKSPEIEVTATLIIASPATDKAILKDTYTGEEYYIFDRKTGDCKPLDLPKAEEGYYTFTFDKAKPENLYAVYQQGSGNNCKIKKLWLISGDKPTNCAVNSSINCKVDCVITDGYVLDANYNSYPIKITDRNRTVPQTTTAGDYEKYLGTWSDNVQGNVGHQVKITSVSGNHITFSVTANYIMVSREETAENIEVDMNNGKGDFSYTDNSGNSGTGTLTLDGGAVHMRIGSENNSGDGMGIDFEADLTDYAPLSE